MENKEIIRRLRQGIESAKIQLSFEKKKDSINFRKGYIKAMENILYYISLS